MMLVNRDSLPRYKYSHKKIVPYSFTNKNKSRPQPKLRTTTIQVKYKQLVLVFYNLSNQLLFFIVETEEVNSSVEVSKFNFIAL